MAFLLPHRGDWSMASFWSFRTCLGLALIRAGGLARQSLKPGCAFACSQLSPREGRASAFSLPTGKLSIEGSPLGGTLDLGSAWPCVLVPGAGTLLWMMFMNPGDQSFWGAFLSIATLSHTWRVRYGELEVGPIFSC